MLNLALARAGLLVSALSGLAGCEGRFPVCKTNADCASRDAGLAGHVCYNLKCVECRYDTDCKLGQTCSALDHECEGISDVRPTAAPDAGAGETVPWEHGSWDQCAAECKEGDCIKACDQKFNK